MIMCVYSCMYYSNIVSAKEKLSLLRADWSDWREKKKGCGHVEHCVCRDSMRVMYNSVCFDGN